MILQLRRWLPQRSLVLVGDGGYAVPVSRHGAGSRSTAANRWLNPLPSSPACAWTPPFMNRRQHVSPVRTVGLR